LISRQVYIASAHSCFAGGYKIGCCNIFGANCAGPCWNSGCETDCQEGKFPGKTVACLGNDHKHTCCPTGSGCITKVPASQTCCSQDFKEIVEVSEFKYQFDKAGSSLDSQAAQLKVIFQGSNAGFEPQDIGTVSQTLTATQTTGWTFSSATALSVKTTISTGIPFVFEGKIELTATETLTYGKTSTTTSSIAVAINTGGNKIAGNSRQLFKFKSKRQVFSVPFTARATFQNQCGDKKTEIISGDAQISGVASFASGEILKLVGPAVPYECKIPFDVPIDEQSSFEFCPGSGGLQCSMNPLCARYEIKPPQGDICCDPKNPFSCCAVAEAHASCKSMGFDSNDVICPSRQGKFHPCCSGAKVENATNLDDMVVIESVTTMNHN